MKLAGKVALITGAGRGIGQAIALLFAKEGADIILCCKENINLLENVKKKVEDFGGNVLAFKMDITDPQRISYVIRTSLNAFGNIDILINNAGNFVDSLVFHLSLSYNILCDTF